MVVRVAREAGEVGPRVRLTRPEHIARDVELAWRRRRGDCGIGAALNALPVRSHVVIVTLVIDALRLLIDERIVHRPVYPIGDDLFGHLEIGRRRISARSEDKVQLRNPLERPSLEAEPFVRVGIRVYRRLLVSQVVERANTGRVSAVLTVPAVRRAAADRTLRRLQPVVELELTRQRSVPIRLPRCGRRRKSSGRRPERVCRHGVLVRLVRMAGADPPSPVAAAADAAAPSRVPGEQVQAGVFAVAGRRRPVAGAADLLEVLVVHAVTQVVAHFLRFIDDRRVVVAELLRPIDDLNGPSVSVGRVRIFPLSRGGRGFAREQRHEAFVRFTERLVVLGRMGDRLPDRLFLSALERIDVSRRMGRIKGVAESVPVVDVDEPVHQVRLVVAVRRFQLGVERVYARRARFGKLRRILVRERILVRVCRRVVRIVVVHRRLFLFAVALIDRNNEFLHARPGGVELRPVARIVAVQRLKPEIIAVRFRSRHMAVVGSLAEQRFDRVIRDALRRKITVRRIFDLLVQLQESILVYGSRRRFLRCQPQAGVCRQDDGCRNP